MSMSREEERHLAHELEKMHGEDFHLKEHYLSTVYQAYNKFDNPLEWKLVELVNASNMESIWHWVKKS